MAPSPSVFLAAVAQRTRRLRFGPLVYTLSLHHPLRVAEEICMLDQMSGGRLELGVGRGVSPHEVAYYGVDPAKAQAMYVEALQVILGALASKSLSFAGEHYTFRDVPIELEPVQRPHPPLWYGLARPEGLPWVVANRVNIVCNGPPALVRQVTDGYRRDWAAAGHGADDPAADGHDAHHRRRRQRRRGAGDRAARAPALASKLHEALGQARHQADQRLLPRQFRRGAGRRASASPARPQPCGTRWRGRSRRRGVNYLVCRLAFGDMALAESLALARAVRPARDAGAGFGGVGLAPPLSPFFFRMGRGLG